jgi:hypothetical protein
LVLEQELREDGLVNFLQGITELKRINSYTSIVGNRNIVRNVGQIDIESTGHVETCISCWPDLNASNMLNCVF